MEPVTKNITVCHISFNHSPFDDRIYWKELLSLKNAGYLTIHIAVGDENEDFLSEEGVRIISIKRKKLSRFSFLNRLLQLVAKKKGTIDDVFKAAKTIKANVYHYHDLQLNAITTKLKKLPHSPKVIYDAHEAYHLLLLEEQPQSFLKKIVYKSYVNLIARWELSKASSCDCIIATDFYTLNYIKKKLPLVYSDIIFNYSYFSPAKISERTKEYHFIYTGLLSKGRGIEEIINAIQHLKNIIDNVKILFLGSFENDFFKNHIQHLIHEKGLTNTIHIKAAVSFLSVPDYYNNAMIGLGLFHSTPKYSTFIPIKLFEYMAFGLPVIFSNHGPSSEIIKKENCGLLVNFSDVDEVAKSMYTLMTNTTLYQQLSANGKKAVEREYNWENEEKKLLSLYQTLLA
jgi:glycosyltransferase involved in cell wall biosynthesis